jgi:predicted dienelactone hydrolase
MQKIAVFNRRQFCRLTVSGAGLGMAPWLHAMPVPEKAMWTDTARSRDIPTLVRWPQDKAQGVVIYSHGLGGKKEGGDVWGKAWAAAGFVVVHLQHPGSDAPSLKGGFTALNKAMQPEQLLARMQDVHFAIAEIKRRKAIADSPWANVPVDQLAVSGHSFGARSTLLISGWQRQGLNGADPQVKAFMVFSPALGKEVSLLQGRKELALATRPMLVLTGSLDGEILNNGETPESRRRVYEALPTGKKALLWLDGADHFTFAGNHKQIPSTILVRREQTTLQAEERHHQLAATLSAAWLREQLLGIPMNKPTSLGSGDEWLRG